MTVRTVADLLAEQHQLSALGEQQLRALACCSRLEVVPAGTVLAREGDPADRFFVVRGGRIAIEARSPGAVVRVESIGPGELVGWSWIFPPHRWVFDVRTVEASKLIVVDGACLRTRCEEDHEFGYRLMRCFSSVVTERLTSARLRLLDLYGGTS